MILDDISTYLATNGVGTEGTDLFIGELPNTQEDCVAIIAAPSPAPNPAIPIYDQIIDVWARYGLTGAAYDKLLQVQSLLHLQSNYELENHHVYFSNAMSAIDDQGEDSESRKLLKLTVRFVYRETEQAS